MQPYQEEYIANLRDNAACKTWNRKGQKKQSFEEWLAWRNQEKQRAEERGKRNMELLREGLFPVLDHIFEAEEETLAQLGEFAGQLLGGGEELDVGLYCQIHGALLSVARRTKNRQDIIRELYCLGMGYFNIYNKLVGLEHEESQKYMSRMRLCFGEAAAYLKYFDEIQDTETRGYILRSRANISLGNFRVPSEKIQIVKGTLQILQDKGYQEKEPGLPWDRYIYLTHQQMAASISHSKENVMSPQDVEDIMESVYIVYQRRLQEAAEQNRKPPLRPMFSYCTIEHYCGMYGLEELLGRLEALMDEADPEDFSPDGLYGIISLTAFYCQYLRFDPELVPRREEYIESLYRRVLDYVKDFPKASENESLFLYLRQLSYTYVETRNSIPYKDFLLNLQMNFTPEVYVHSKVVAEAAAAFCRIIIEEEPGFFDDIPSIREIEDPEEKRREIFRFARESGMLFDAGKLNFMNLYSQAARQWLEEEYEMAHLHTLVGARWLEDRDSTRAYAPVALGHHYWYDGSRGYPETYQRLECPCRQMVDIIGLLDWINNVTETARLHMGMEKTFEEAVEEAIALEGKRFSPLLTVRLRDPSVVEQVKKAYTEGRREAYLQLYEWHCMEREKEGDGAL